MYQKIRKLLFRTLVPAVLAAMMIPMTAFGQGKSCTVTIPAEIQVTGSSVPTDVEYKLVMERVTENAPLPEVTEVTRTGAGQVSFGPITYTSPDDYHYRIFQKSETQDRFTYDTTVYLLTVRVTNSAAAEGGLAYQVWLANEADETVKADDLLFTNSYSRPYSPGGSSGGDDGGGGSTPRVVADGLTEIADDPTPQSAWPELVEIANDLVPLGLPQTGDTTMLGLWGVLAALSGGGLILLLAIRRREYE